VSVSTRPEVAGIVVSYRSAGEIGPALESLFSELPGGSPIVVVDQASGDGTVEIVRKEFPRARIVVEAVNRGFAAGVNRGVAAIPADWYLLLNPDAWLESGAFDHLWPWASRSEAIGGICPLVRLAPPRDAIDSIGIHLTDALHAGSVLAGSPGDMPLTGGEVFGFHGAAALLRGKMIRETGGFDERFFCYMEEFDLSWRARRLGWRFVAEPRARVRHQVSASSRGFAFWREYQMERNRWWAIVKNADASDLIVAARSIGLSELEGFRYGLLGPAPWVLSARWDAMRGSGDALRRRRRIERGRGRLRTDVVDRWRGVEGIVPAEWSG
jgi:GT2 family glycosyltransferase